MDPNARLALRRSVASGASNRYPEPIAARVFEMHLTTGKALLIHRDAELLGDASMSSM
jgi:hypothetical protein